MSGGTEWEQGQAVTRMVEALQKGDHATMALAMADYAAALGTRTTSLLSAIVAPVLLELQAARLERETNTRIVEHKLDLILLANDAMQSRIQYIEAATLANELGATERRELINMIRTIPNLTERIGRLEAGNAE